MIEGSETTPGVSPELLEILVCPVDKAKVELDEDSLVCTVCGRRYGIENGIPNMLADED